MHRRGGIQPLGVATSRVGEEATESEGGNTARVGAQEREREKECEREKDGERDLTPGTTTGAIGPPAVAPSD